jgi:fluoroacetyl-CoA thioesterase
MNAIPVGAKGSFSMIIAPEHLASRFKDPTLPPVFATPLMILFMENAALNAIREYLAPGESALGTAVNIRHRLTHASPPHCRWYGWASIRRRGIQR